MAEQMIRGSEINEEGITLKDLLRTALRYRFMVGLIVFAGLAFAGVYLFIAEPLYQASGDLIVEMTSSSLLSDKIKNQYDEQVPLVTINDAMIKIKGTSITDSVIVKTASFVTLGIPGEYYYKIKYFSAMPPQSTMTFSIIPSQKDNADYIVLSDTGSLIGKGNYNKKFESKYFSIILADLRPVKSFDIILEPLRQVRSRFAGNIKATNSRDSNVIQLSFNSYDPVKAKTIVNTYLNEMAYQDLIAKREKATTLKKFLEDQFRTVSSSIENTENTYLDSKMSKGIVSLNEQTTQYIDLMRFLEEKRIDYEIKLEEATVSKEKAAAILKGDPELQSYSKFASSPFMQDNTILQELYSKVASLQVDNAKLKSRYNASHPLVLQSNAELEAAQKQLNDAISTTVNNATKGLDPMLRPIVESQLSNNININVYQQLLSRIKKEIATLNGTLERLPKSEIEKARYDRNIGINSQIHDLLLTRLEEARIMEASAVSDIKVVNWAETPSSPISPNRNKVLLLALISSLFLSGVLIFTIEHFKPSFGTAENIESTLGAPVLAMIPRISNNGSGQLERQILVDPAKKEGSTKFQMYELFNAMLINLFASEHWSDQKVLVVSSTFAKEGKSVVSANLAVMMARTGKKVLLIDCDFRGPVQHTIFGVPNANGFADLIKNNSTKGFVKTAFPNLIFLPAGNTGDIVISELFHDPNMAETVKMMENRFDMIIIDSPPVMLYTDAVVLSSHFKNVLMVIKSSTDGEAVQRSKKLLAKVNANIIGIVVNDVKKSFLFGNSYDAYAYGYGYGYGYGDGKDELKED